MRRTLSSAEAPIHTARRGSRKAANIGVWAIVLPLAAAAGPATAFTTPSVVSISAAKA